METNSCHPHPIVNMMMVITLAVLGEAAGFMEAHNDVLSVISFLFQMFAWGGAGVIGIVSVLKYLQDTGWINMKKKKKGIKDYSEKA